MKTGLFFGSFNPIHIGHLAIANYALAFTEIEQLWFIVSPQNPFKEKQSLLPDYHRLELLVRAIDDYPGFRASSIEFNLPKPSYTIDTLTYIGEKYPDNEFYLILGADQLASFHKWKNPDELITNYRFLVYPRPNVRKHQYTEHPSFSLFHAPIMEISSSFIRSSIKDGKDVRFFLPKKVWEYIEEMNFYK